MPKQYNQSTTMESIETKLNHPSMLKTLAYTGVVAAGVGTAYWLSKRYHVCPPNKWMVRTGLGIKDMLVSRKGIQWPFQSYKMIVMDPRTIPFDLHNMSSEKVPFSLPTVFTVVPKDPSIDLEGFKRYAQFMSDATKEEFEKTVGGVVHGETRILTGSMTIEELFNDRERFRSTVWNNIQKDLDQFGIHIKNANISEMQDLPGNGYFEYRKQKAIQSANNQARVEVAEAKRVGDIGEYTKQADAVQQKALVESTTAKVQNERQREIAESEKTLKTAQADYLKQVKTAELEAKMSVEIRNAELARELETKKVQQMTETLRAKDFTQANVNAECQIKEAEGSAIAKRTQADAHLYNELKRAEGLKAVLEAQAEGVARLVEASKGDTKFAQFYLANNSGLLVEFSKNNALAIQGLKPNITVWNTGAGGDSDAFKTIRDIGTAVPMVTDILDKQGLSLPDWLIKKNSADKDKAISIVEKALSQKTD